ncbi:hypothetical protein HHK36_000637 [Tetracentron sinense]|uniref:VQ domain-containing protein n=1 Tax=Tetracentron sinense TaxID=13715 RepID=A0A835DU07_TETSI|nr:hypothetical protein HHK36_000637 [Tetracentron sinense]
MGMRDQMSSPSDWVQFYQRTLAGQGAPPVQGSSTAIFGGQVSDATVVTTSVTSATTPSPLGTSNSSASSVHLNPEGRVSKPTRRRSRASRRTPTTLLNTDTTNFRAMVQQFTGGPSAPFSSGVQTSATNLNFGFGGRLHHLNPTTIMVPSGYHLQQQQQQQYQQQQYMFSLNNTGSGDGGGGGSGDVFLPRISNSRPNLEISEGFVIGNMSSHVLPTSSSSNGNRNNGFIS